MDFGERMIVLELQRRTGGVLTRDQTERAVQLGSSAVFDEAVERLVGLGLLVVNKRGGQELISLTLAGRSARTAEGEPP